jgi:hypothetical protein
MHWRTYLRLRDQANAAEAEAEYLWAKSIPGHEKFLDPAPPRRNASAGTATPRLGLSRYYWRRSGPIGPS